MRRTDRLYALVEELRARAPRPVSRLDLADRLEITPRTVERDISALQHAGVPIWSQRGRGGGYAIDPAWSLPPLNFDATEALAVIAALTTARSMPFADAGRRAQQKLLAAMTTGEAARAKELAGRVRFGTFGTPGAQSIVAAVEHAVVDRRVVEIDYRDKSGATSTRIVEAHGLHLAGTGTYLVGWCRLRDGGRAFRIDRIVAVRPTDELAAARQVDDLLDWVDDAVAPSAFFEEGEPMPARKRSGSWGGGPPRRAQDRTGSNPAFARAIAAALDGVDVEEACHGTTFAVGATTFLVVDDDDTIVVGADPAATRTFVLGTVGRDEVRSMIEDAWAALAPARKVTAHRRRRTAWSKLPAVTQDDIRRVVLALPGAAEGPIWGQSLGFLIGTEKRTRFARFGPPASTGVSNLLPPDEDDTLVLLRCAQKPSLLAASPDRYFTTPHYGGPEEPGGVIVRLTEHRGPDGLAELSELLEDAWREVAPQELQDQLDGARR